MKKERYHISGMTCSACSSHVEKSVNKLSGVDKASVNLLTETMDIVYNEQELSQGQIESAVSKAGYGATLMEGNDHRAGGGAELSGTSASVDCGSTCGAASGVSASGANRRGGVGGSSRNSVQEKAAAEAKAMKWRLGISIGFLIPLMYVAMYHMYHSFLHIPIPNFMMNWFHGSENAMTFALTQLLLLLPILYMNRKFFSVGFKTLRHLSPNMDSLIALGAGASLAYGIFAMYRISYGLGHGQMEVVERYSHDLYFESAGMILTLITVGKYLESRSKGKTSEAITKLMDLSPKTAILVKEDGTEVEVPTETVTVGDIFLVKPGSLVPVDGTVLEGNSSIDEAAITGESVPVEKQAGDKVVSATVNKSGFLKCRADRVGEDTTLAQIIRLVEEASGSKAPIAQLADKVAGVFVPVVMGIALLTLIIWLLMGAGAEFAISSAIAVLVISCPCALGLATPVAIMVGTGVGANHGILIKSGEALQQARDIDTVVMDKTGTITSGKLKVMGTDVYTDMTLESMVQIAAALEKKSEHPLAEAIVEYAEEQGLILPEVEQFQAVFGRGIEGVKAGTRFFVGNQAYMEEQGIAMDAQTVEGLNRVAEKGMTPLLVAREGRLLGSIHVADEVKPSSRTAIQSLRKMGIHVVMLTGDNKRTAEAVRSRIGIEEVVAEVLPQDKEKKISELKAAGRKVAMIGDGINDAPALAAADVGMAIGAGTDVAMESADIVLMKSDLRDAVTAIRLSRQVIRNIKQNLFWAFFYNAIGIPLAAGLLYIPFQIRLTPMFGAAAMSLSSIFVVGNALRLRGFQSSFKTSKQATTDPSNNATTNNNQPQESEEITMTKTMTIEGMMCAHCTGRVQKALEAIEGVSTVTMNLEAKTATLTLTTDIPDPTLTTAVTEAGYQVTSIS